MRWLFNGRDKQETFVFLSWPRQSLCFQCGRFPHQSTARPDPVALERERLLSTVQEEASIAKDKVKQLSQVRSFTLAAIPLQFFAN